MEEFTGGDNSFYLYLGVICLLPQGNCPFETFWKVKKNKALYSGQENQTSEDHHCRRRRDNAHRSQGGKLKHTTKAKIQPPSEYQKRK